MIIHPHTEQGSEAWFDARKGRPTASRFSDFITPAKCDLSKSATNFALELISECFFPQHAAFFGTPWTDRGVDIEPEARAAFTELTGYKVEQVGFVTRDDGVVGCSPDGLITYLDEKFNYCEGLELKCPAPKTHVRYVFEGVLPDEYKLQVHGSMAVTGLDRWHFFSYAPGVQPFHLVVQRDAYTEKLSATLDEFLILYADLREKMIPRLMISTPTTEQP
jgi:hypothetical protein